ncbi:MAG: chemotaxis protein CheW [Cyanobacteria bacterium P01_A01_bin.17]
MSAVAERPSTALEQRLVLAQVGAFTLAIPALWVSEIARFELSQMLELPFYPSPLMGLMHQGGQVVPLVSAAQLLLQERQTHQERPTVICLGEAAESLNQVGIVVDKILGSTTHSDVPATLFEPIDISALSSDQMVLLSQEWFSADVWKPQQWAI